MSSPTPTTPPTPPTPTTPARHTTTTPPPAPAAAAAGPRRSRARAAGAGDADAGRERERVGEWTTIYRDVRVSRKWSVQYNVGRRQVRRSLKVTSVAAARAAAKVIDAGLVLGLQPNAGAAARAAADARPVPLADAAEQYLLSLRTRRRSPGTLVGYRSKLTVFEAFCAGLTPPVVDLRRATAGVLEAYQRALEERGVVPPAVAAPSPTATAAAAAPAATTAAPRRPRRRGPGFKAAGNAPRTVRDKLKIVRQLIRWARRRNLLRADPAAGFDLPPAVKTKAYCWTAAELTAILAHAPPLARDPFDFLRLTGLRAGEFCWLTRDDLVPDPPHVKVRAKACPAGSGRTWKPKHGNERVVPLCPAALAIATRAAAAAARAGSPWLFAAPARRGAGVVVRWRKGRLWLLLKAAMRAGGVARGTVHTFRHAYCSHLVRRGASAFAVMKLMGHGSLDIVLAYADVTQQDLQDAVAAAAFDAMLVPPTTPTAVTPATTPAKSAPTPAAANGGPATSVNGNEPA